MTARKPVPLSFFMRPAADVARELIGMTLVRVTDEGTRRYMIVETEAYEGAGMTLRPIHPGADRPHRRYVRTGRSALYLPGLRPSLDAQRRHG